MRYPKVFILMLFLICPFYLSEKSNSFSHNQIDWQAWYDAIFQKAKQENRYILLDLEAVWCNWCHVMDQKTYSDPKVQADLRDRFIAAVPRPLQTH